MNLADRLRAARKAANMSQEAVARRSSMSLNSYADIERGYTTDPHLSTLKRICRSLKIPLSALVPDEYNTPIDPRPERRRVEADESQRTRTRVEEGAENAQVLATSRSKLIDDIEARYDREVVLDLMLGTLDVWSGAASLDILVRARDEAQALGVTREELRAAFEERYPEWMNALKHAGEVLQRSGPQDETGEASPSEETA